MGKYSFSLSDLKKQLGPGLGIRSNRYLIEVPLPGPKAKKLAILARSTSLPEKNIGTVETFYKGRRFKMRGETDLQSTYTINVIDDDKMIIRQLFESWMRKIDNTTPKTSSALGIFGDAVNDLLEGVSGVLQFINNAKTAFQFDGGAGFLKNVLTDNPGAADYQVEVNIWQLSNENNKIYGVKLQNAFPIELGAVEVNVEEENALSQFSITFAYSDQEPLKDEGFMKKIVDAAIGPTGQDIRDSVENLLD